jgi:glucokinase
MQKSQKLASLGIDLGGTNLRAALVDQAGKVLDLRLEQAADLDPQAVLEKLVFCCRQLIGSGVARGFKVVSAGLGVAGKIDSSKGLVVFSPNLPNLNGYRLGQNLEDALQLPVFTANDADVFGLGESFAGAARGFANWVGIVLGTGAGGCLFFDGKLWEGDHLGFCAEIGHMIVEPGGPACPCGSKGCLESFASARALVDGAKRALSARKITEGPLRELEKTGKLSARAIFECAQNGDTLCLELFEKMGWALGLTLANLFSALGIRRAVIGGGVGGAFELFIGPLEKTLAANCSMLGRQRPRIVRGLLGDSAALIGAARLNAASG